MSIRKPTIYMCENKDADQLCSNCTDDQLLLVYTNRTIPLLLNSEISHLVPRLTFYQFMNTQTYVVFHYENMPMQYTEIFLALKIENFQLKNFDIFLIFAQNIDFGYTLEPPRRGGSNEYPQSMFWSKNKKNRFTPVYPSFAI